MLTRLYVDNYRCFVNFEFRPDQKSLLVGDNGSGKTTLFEVILRLRSLVRHGANVHDAFPSHERTAWERRSVQKIELDVTIAGSHFAYALQIAHEETGGRQTVVIRSEQISVDGKPLFGFADGLVHLFHNDHSPAASFAFSGERSFLASIEPTSDNQQLATLLNWLSQIWEFRLDPTRIREAWIAPNEVRSLERDGSNFAAFYRLMVQEDPEAVERLQRDLRIAIRGFQRMRLVSYGDQKGLFVQFAAGDSGMHELAFSKLSDGQAVLVVLYTVLHAIGLHCALLCIDEPGNFVALREIQPWLQELADRFEGQALIISHHPEVIDYLAADSAFLLHRPEGGLTRIQRLLFRVDEGLKASEQLARGWTEGLDAG